MLPQPRVVPRLSFVAPSKMVPNAMLDARQIATGTDWVSDPQRVRVPVLVAETCSPGPGLTGRSVMTGSPLRVIINLTLAGFGVSPEGPQRIRREAEEARSALTRPSPRAFADPHRDSTGGSRLRRSTLRTATRRSFSALDTTCCEAFLRCETAFLHRPEDVGMQETCCYERLVGTRCRLAKPISRW